MKSVTICCSSNSLEVQLGSLFSSNRRVVVNIEALVLIFASDAGVETSTGHGCIDSM